MVAGCFLRKQAGFLFAILFSSTVFAQEIGLELYSLRDQFAKDAPGTMAKVKAMGFKEVELAGTYGLEFPEFIKLLAMNELTVISYGGDYDKLKSFPQKIADEARAYGSKYVAVFWIPHDASKGFTADDVDRAAEVLNTAGKVIARQGMALVYHPHGYEFQPYKDGTLFDYMVEKFDQRFVNFEMDVFWAKQAGQNPVELLHKYKTRFLLLHLKDRKKGTKNSTNGEASVESNVVLGSGDVGIAEVMKEAKDNGIQHVFIEDESSRSEEQIPKSLKYLRSLH